MKFSENWLRQHVPTDATRDELAATLTAIGLEVEEVTPLGESLDGVVVARIVECEQASRSRPPAGLQGRCRAGRAAADRVRCAECARRAWSRRWRRSAPRSATSRSRRPSCAASDSNGMLCSAKELGIDADASGLLELPDDAPVGAPLADYLVAARRQHRDQADPQPRRLFQRARHRLRRGRGLRQRRGRLRCHADARVDRAVRWRSNCMPVPKAPRFVGRVIEGVDATRRHAGVDGRAPAPQRRAPGQFPGRRHPVRDAGTRAADACLRPRHC